MDDESLSSLARHRRRAGLPLPVPLRVTLEVTRRCNSRCIHCSIWKGYDGIVDGPEMSSPELLLLTRNLLDSGIRVIDVTGGEPFLSPAIADVGTLILGRTGFLCVTTSALLPGRILAAIERIVAAAPSEALCVVSVSIDGLEETNDRIRNVPGNFAKSIHLLTELGAMRCHFPALYPQVSFTLTDENAEEMPRLLEWLLERSLIEGPDAFSFRANDGGPYYGVPRPARPRPALAAAAEHMCGSFNFVRSRSFYEGIPDWLRGRSSPLMGKNCFAGFASCWIDAWGNVSPCIQMTDVPFGNLRDTGFDLAPIWNSPRAAVVRAIITGGRCPDCWTDCQAEENIRLRAGGS